MKIATLGLAGALALAAWAQPASAADIPVKAAPAPAPAVYSWAGFYFGAHAGYGWARAEIFDVQCYCMALNGIPRVFGFNYDGFIGGGQVGYLWQQGNLVYGIELDASYSRMKTSFPSPLFAPIFGESFSAKVDWFATGRVRVGYAFDRWLPFGTVGIAAVKMEDRYNDPLDDRFSVVSGVKWAPTGGGGIEYAISRNWTVRAEYLYVRLFTSQGNFAQYPPCCAFDWKNHFHVARGAINFRL